MITESPEAQNVEVITSPLKQAIAQMDRLVTGGAVCREWVVGFDGPRGGGKSLGASFMTACDFLIHGVPVWSNIPINLTLYLGSEQMHFASQPIESAKLFTLDGSLRRGCVFIDELNYWSEARRSSSTKNLLLNSIFQQTRKRALSFIFSVQDIDWIDLRLRFQLDVHIICNDLAYGPWGREENLGLGELFSWGVRDISGALTGFRYKETGFTAFYRLWGKPLWDIYNSYDIQDIFEAMSGIEVAQPKMRIEVGKDEQVEQLKREYAQYESAVLALKQSGIDIIRDIDLWDTLGISDRSERMKAGQALRAMGVTKKQRKSGYYYVLGDLTAASLENDE